MNPLKALWEEHGQAAWLDYIERDLLTGGGLERLTCSPAADSSGSWSQTGCVA